MAQSSSENDQTALWERLPEDGRSIAASKLMRELGWPATRYQEAEQALLVAGRARRGRGRGGPLKRQPEKEGIPGTRPDEMLHNADSPKRTNDVNPANLDVTSAADGSHLDADQLRLLDALPANGATQSNPALRKKLRWSEDRYLVARNSLEDKNLIIRGRGRGGTVSRAVESDVDDAGSKASSISAQKKAVSAGELALYEPLRTTIEDGWAPYQRITPIVVEIVGLQGKKQTGGAWSRPDIVVVAVQRYTYLPEKYIDVITFEVKLWSGLTVQAVYEALAHRRAATRSYLLVQVPDEQAPQDERLMIEVARVAREHGVGLITFTDATDYETWDDREDAVRSEPDPERLDGYLRTQLRPASREKVANSVR